MVRLLQNLSAVLVITMHCALIMLPLYTSKMGMHKSCNRLSIQLLLSDCCAGTIDLVFPLLDFPCGCWLFYGGHHKDTASFGPAVIAMTMHNVLIMQPLYTSKMAQQNLEWTNIETDCQSNNCYPITVFAVGTRNRHRELFWTLEPKSGSRLS